MLVDQLDYVIGVDPHCDSHALAIVHVLSGAVVFEAIVAALRTRCRLLLRARRSTQRGSSSCFPFVSMGRQLGDRFAGRAQIGYRD